MFFIGLTGGWEMHRIHVPSVPNAYAVSCYQTVDETATADCFYVEAGEHGQEAMVRHIALEPEDQTV